jgi:hypothetical protein
MKMNYFISGASLLIAGWLVMTFFHEVSPLQYPKQRRGALPAQTANRPAAMPAATRLTEVSTAAGGLAAVKPGE